MTDRQAEVPVHARLLARRVVETKRRILFVQFQGPAVLALLERFAGVEAARCGLRLTDTEARALVVQEAGDELRNWLEGRCQTAPTAAELEQSALQLASRLAMHLSFVAGGAGSHAAKLLTNAMTIRRLSEKQAVQSGSSDGSKSV